MPVLSVSRVCVLPRAQIPACALDAEDCPLKTARCCPPASHRGKGLVLRWVSRGVRGYVQRGGGSVSCARVCAQPSRVCGVRVLRLLAEA